MAKCEICGSNIQSRQLALDMEELKQEIDYCNGCYVRYIKGNTVYVDGKYLYRVKSDTTRMVRVESVEEIALRHTSCKMREAIASISGRISALQELLTTIEVQIKEEKEKLQEKRRTALSGVIQYG